MMRFLLLDDHPAILELVALRLASIDPDWECVRCTTQEEALVALKTQKIDRALLDLQLEEGKSLEIPKCCDALNIPYGIYSSYLHPSILKQLTALNYGVFVVKSAPLDDLDRGLRALSSGTPYACSRTKESLLQLEESTHSQSLDMPKISDAERRVLECYMEGLTTSEIARHLKLSPVTVQNHKARMVHRNGASLQELIQRYLFWNHA
jgi:DNA-binding NarL/FixJ family response regulator